MHLGSFFAVLALGLAGRAAAFSGSFSVGPTNSNGKEFFYVLDYKSLSIYRAESKPISGCTGNGCGVTFKEITYGGYSFQATVEKDGDGCHLIKFNNALSAGTGRCCGPLPCNMSA